MRRTTNQYKRIELRQTKLRKLKKFFKRKMKSKKMLTTPRLTNRLKMNSSNTKLIAGNETTKTIEQ